MRVVEEFPNRVVVRDPVWITMPDGTRLAARIWLPDDAEARPVPAILEYLPYRRRDGTAVRDALTHPYFAGHGYACVRVDMRGTGDSGGLLLDEYLPQEQQDALAVIAWLACQPWCDGSVGMMGISWGGFNALQVAARRPPALRAVISLCSTDDRYADDVHYMGGALLLDNLRWASTMLGYQTRPPDPDIVGERWREMWVQRLQAEPLMLRTWLRHQSRDAYWKHGSVCEDPAAITAACYLIGGWADSYSNAVPRMLERLRCPRKGLVGPWTHRYPHFATPAPAIGFLQEALRWWDQWLKGRATGIMGEPLYRVWLEEYTPPSSEHAERPGRWVAETSWPSPRIEWQAFPLGEGTLGAGAAATAPVVIATPQHAGEEGGAWCAYGSGHEGPGDQRRDDGLSVCFDSVPLRERMEILGAAELEAMVTVDASNAVLIARLCDVAPDGASLRVSYGVLNLTHRNGRERPEPLPAGLPVAVRLRLNDCAHAFPAGHRIRLALSNAYWPLIWPSPAPARLELAPADARLLLPRRPPRKEDGLLAEFPAPEGAAPLKRTMLDPPRLARRATGDKISGEVALDVADDTGLFRIDDTGLEYRLSSVESYVIVPDDPLSARAEISLEMVNARDAWSTRAVTRTVLRATRTEFLITATLDAWEGEEQLASRNWNVAIARRGV
jgi:putative CocE/NonD family hydrolase